MLLAVDVPLRLDRPRLIHRSRSTHCSPLTSSMCGNRRLAPCSCPFLRLDHVGLERLVTSCILPLPCLFLAPSVAAGLSISYCSIYSRLSPSLQLSLGAVSSEWPWWLRVMVRVLDVWPGHQWGMEPTGRCHLELGTPSTSTTDRGQRVAWPVPRRPIYRTVSAWRIVREEHFGVAQPKPCEASVNSPFDLY